MGYNFTIGEAKLNYTVYRGQEYIEKYVKVDCDSLYSEDCVDFTDSGKSSQRDPSYSGWSEFCKEVGLEEVFYNESKKRDYYILQEHPGVYPLTIEDLNEFKLAKKNYQKKHPQARIVTHERFPPEYRDMDIFKRMPYDQTVPKEDWNLSRLEWLCFWTDYAIKVCKHPVFKNT